MTKIRYLMLIVLIFPCLVILSACNNIEGYKINFMIDDEIYGTKEISQYDTIIVPDNPQKEGYNFDGWYWDNNEWNYPYTTNSLLNTPLEKEMNVYAKFVKICNHINSQWSVITPATCLKDGLEKIYCVECGVDIETRTIEAEGHKFDNWFTSRKPTIYENGISRRNCLICGYYETVEIPKVEIVEPTKIMIENGILKWDGESNYGFEVIVNGYFYRIYANELDVNLKSDDYNNVEVAGIKKNGERTEYVKLNNFVVNAPITNLHYTDDGSNVTFTWDSPNNLYDYTFIVGETENTVDKNDNSYTIDRNSLESGSVVSVFVQGMDVANFYPSKKKTITLQQLDAPSLYIDKLDIKWNAISGADNYKVEALTTKTITNTTYSYDGANAGEHTITVTACGVDYLSNNTTYTFNKLVCPEITIENNIVTWIAIAGQVRYATLINDNETKFVGNSYTITNTEDEYDIYLYASPVPTNTMMSDRVIISKFTYGEYSTVYYGTITNNTPTYTKVIYDNYIYVPNKYIDNVNLSNATSSVALIACKVPTGLAKTLVTNIIIPDGTTEIVAATFSGCSNALSVSVPESVTSIGSNAFYNCTSLKKVTFVENSKCKSIGAYAFYDCDFLTKVYYGGTKNDWNNISIDIGNRNLTDATRYYYSEEKPTDNDNYWHYVDGVIKVWE